MAITSNTNSASRKCGFFVFAAIVALALLPIGMASNAWAQTTSSASIQGTVSDPSGATIAGANVMVTNKGTGLSQSVVSDSQGRYKFADLIIGTYDLQTEKDGFQKVLKTGIQLAVGTASVVDIALPVGQSLQTVTVEATNVQVETTTAQVSTLIDNKQLTDLPLNNRSLANLILLAPGVNVYSNAFTQGAFYGGGFTFSVGGGRPNGQAMVLDDSDVQDYYSHGSSGGALGTYMGVDAIGQFQILTNTYSAQFGGAGSVVNQATKSGTNSFHGSGYEFFRNSAMDARSWFDGNRTAPFRKNQFGGALGGPIKKDKMFFFVNYEGLRQLYAPAKVFTVPDTNTHNGMLPCNLLTAAIPGNCASVKSGNSTPQPLVNVGVKPSIAPYLAFFDQFFPRPATELYSNGLPTGTGQETLFLPEIGTENYVVARYDWTLSDKDSIFVRYLGDFSLLNNDNITGPWHPDLEYNRNQFATVEEKHIFSANVINSGRFAFSRPFQRSNPGSKRFPIFCYYTSAQCGTLPADGGFTYGGGITAVGAGSPGPWRFNQNKFAVGDDVFWVHGAHSFKFGGEAKRVQSDAWSPLGLGSWSFGSLQNLLTAVPSTFAGVFLDSSGNLLDNSYRYFRETQFAIYAQDDWKVLPTLTLNLGLRYEPGTNISEINGNLNYILIPGTFISPTLPGASAYTNVPNVFANNPSLHNLDPRIGIAWDPFKDHKTSIRAGFGLFHNIIGPREFGAESYNNPPFKTGTALNPAFTVTENPALLAAAKPSQSFGLDYFIHNTPYVEQWNLTVERELINNTIVSLGYVGSHSVHQIVESNLNPVTCSPASAACTAASTGQFATYNPAANTIVQSPNLNPNFQTLTIGRTVGFAKYDAGQLAITRRLSNNFQAQLSYTYSECRDNGSGSYLVDGGTTFMDPYNSSYDVGWCSYYARNNLTVNGLYTLPFHKNLLVEGWQISSIYSYHSGYPVLITTGVNQAPTGGGSNRPDFTGAAGCGTTGNGPLVKNFTAQTVTHALLSSCFALPPVGFFGTPIGRNTATAPGGNQLDGTISKTTPVKKVSEEFAVQFRAEFFNLLNHPQFGAPTAGLCSLTSTVVGGVVTPACNVLGSFGQITTASPGRQVQFGLKILF